MEYTTSKEIAKTWGISNRRVNTLCNSNRIAGAYKNGLMWLIPTSAKKPEDRRKTKLIVNNVKFEELRNIQENYEKSLKVDFKKDNGIYYTPYELIDLMYSELNISKNSIIVDPCCGMGNFLIGAIKNGFNNVYGVDNDRDAVKYISKLLKTNNIICYDSINNPAENTLSELGIQEPNLLIGNPPYVSHGSMFGDLFVGSIIRSLDMLKNNGLLSYIVPKNFLHVSKYQALREVILSQYQILSIVDIGIYFKNVRGEQIILTIKKIKPTSENMITFKELKDGQFLERNKVKQKIYTDEIRFFMTSNELAIYEKFKSSYETLENYCQGYIGRGKSKEKLAIIGKNIRKFGFKDQAVPSLGNKIFIQNIYSTESGIIGSFAGNLEAKETVTVIIDSNPEKCKYLVGLLHSRLINYYLFKYCFNGSKLTNHTDKKYIFQIPIVKAKDEKYNLLISLVDELQILEYLEANWHNAFEKLNNLVYDIYGLNNEEKIFIENYMKNIQSSRWTKDE